MNRYTAQHYNIKHVNRVIPLPHPRLVNHFSCSSPQHTPPQSATWPDKVLPLFEHTLRDSSYREDLATVRSYSEDLLGVDKYIQVFPNQKPWMTSIVWMLLQARDDDSDAALAEELKNSHRLPEISPNHTSSDSKIFIHHLQPASMISTLQPSPQSSPSAWETGSTAHSHQSPSDPGTIPVCLPGRSVVDHSHPLGTEAPWTPMSYSKMLFTEFTSAFNTIDLLVFMPSSSELPPPTGAWIKDFVINWPQH